MVKFGMLWIYIVEIKGFFYGFIILFYVGSRCYMIFVKFGMGIIRIVCYIFFYDRIGDELFVFFYIFLCFLFGEFVSYLIGDFFIFIIRYSIIFVMNYLFC